jgi:hypothetical protein
LTVLTVEDTCICTNVWLYWLLKTHVYVVLFDCTDCWRHMYMYYCLTVLTVEDTCICTTVWLYWLLKTHVYVVLFDYWLVKTHAYVYCLTTDCWRHMYMYYCLTVWMLKTHVYILIFLTVLTVEDTCIYTNMFDCTDCWRHMYMY